MIQNHRIQTKVILSRELCDIDAIRYVASRYGTTPEAVLEHYLVQTGIVVADENHDSDMYDLMPNEIALLRDLGVQPSSVEIR